MVLPEIQSEAFSQRARDELPQSAAGRTIMTTEPKFVPEQAVSIDLEDGASFRTRLIDCVGYMVPGAMGHEENEKPRMVKSPWFDEEVPFDVAAETGTRKVICEHSTIGLVVTTDGSISDIPRSGYEKAEERVIQELEAIQKPFIILLNCVAPESLESMTLAEELSKKYGRTVMPVSCVELTEETITEILKNVLFEFPLKEIAFFDAQMGHDAGSRTLAAGGCIYSGTGVCGGRQRDEGHRILAAGRGVSICQDQQDEVHRPGHGLRHYGVGAAGRYLLQSVGRDNGA